MSRTLVACAMFAAFGVGCLFATMLLRQPSFEPRNIKPLQRTLLDARYPLLRMGLTAICDPKNGNLIYLHREGRQTSMAVVPEGCKDVLMNLEREQ